MRKRLAIVSGVLLAAFGLVEGAAARQTAGHHGHDPAALDARGALVMGFDQQRTAHHFLIRDDGGAIQVTVRNAADTGQRQAIRTHLRTIAGDFAEGRFDAPRGTHAEDPEGVGALTRLRDRISYRYEDIDGGGRVSISTSDPEALAAAHAFLRYQITEHGTGDPIR